MRGVGSTALLVSALSLVAAGAAVARWCDRPGTSEFQTPRRGAVLASGLVLSAGNGEQPAIVLSAERVLRRKRRAGVWSLNLFHDLVIEEARLEIHLPDTDGSASLQAARTPFDRAWEEVPDPLAELARVLQLGAVGRVVLERLEIEVFADAIRLFQLRAGSARIGGELGPLQLSGGVFISAASGQRLEAQRARWTLRSPKLKIEGPYRLSEPGKTTEGVGEAIALGQDGRIARVAEQRRDSARIFW